MGTDRFRKYHVGLIWCDSVCYAPAANLCKGRLTAYLEDEMVKTERSGVFHIVPLGYWETCDARQWGIIGSISEKSIRVRSDVNMPIGAKLKIRIFRTLGHDFDGSQALVEITGKEPCWGGGSEAYEYEFEFIVISEEDRLKLGNSLTIREEKRRSALGWA
jgi:hypothetical protein